MSRQITIHLPEAQCDALAAEAKAAGRSFFDHCRQKLLANMTVPAEPEPQAVDLTRLAQVSDKRPKSLLPPRALNAAETDRMDRLEAMMMRMAESIQHLTNPQHIHEGAQGDAGNIDVDDVVNQSLQAVEAMPVMQAEQAAPPSGGVRHVGTRLKSRYAVGNVPDHLRGLAPS